MSVAPSLFGPSADVDHGPSGPDPARPFIHHHRLSPSEAQHVHQLAQWCRHRFVDASDPEFLDTIAEIRGDLPRGVRAMASRARLDDRKHAVLISGTVVDETTLEPTPLHWRDGDTSGSAVYGFVLSLLGSLFGDGIGWASQQGGRLITDVLPSPGEENSLVSSCSERELGWHTEDAFSPYRADHVGLLCMRSPDPAPTTMSYVDPGALPDEIAGVLAEPRFELLPDSSHEVGVDPAVHTEPIGALEHAGAMTLRPAPVPLLHGAADAPVLRIDRDFVKAADGDVAAERALRWIIRVIDENLYDVDLHPGDVCFIDNRNVVHGRRSFTPRFDGTDRWLKRLNLVTDLRRTRPGRRAEGSRVIG